MARSSKLSQKGFSLIEAMIVIAIMSIVLGMAVLALRPTLNKAKADSAAAVVSEQLRVARQMAIAKRRLVKLTIDQTISAPDYAPHIQYQILNLDGLTADPNFAVMSLPLPNSASLVTLASMSISKDTIEQSGSTGNAVYIGGSANGPAAGMVFNSAGAFTTAPVSGGNASATTTPLNGTIYVGIPNKPETLRAITILGATGRARVYYWTGTDWRE